MKVSIEHRLAHPFVLIVCRRKRRGSNGDLVTPRRVASDDMGRWDNIPTCPPTGP